MHAMTPFLTVFPPSLNLLVSPPAYLLLLVTASHPRRATPTTGCLSRWCLSLCWTQPAQQTLSRRS